MPWTYRAADIKHEKNNSASIANHCTHMTNWGFCSVYYFLDIPDFFINNKS